MTKCKLAISISHELNFLSLISFELSFNTRLLISLSYRIVLINLYSRFHKINYRNLINTLAIKASKILS